MTRMWCINCQREVKHRPAYGVANDTCCAVCARNTLAYIQPRTGETQEEMIKQMVGEAQRVAQSTGRTGDIEVLRGSRNSVSGEFETKILVYNTNTGFYRVRNQ